MRDRALNLNVICLNKYINYEIKIHINDIWRCFNQYNAARQSELGQDLNLSELVLSWWWWWAPFQLLLNKTINPEARLDYESIIQYFIGIIYGEFYLLQIIIFVRSLHIYDMTLLRCYLIPIHKWNMCQGLFAFRYLIYYIFTCKT